MHLRAKIRRQPGQKVLTETGSTLVEVALSSAVLLSLIFGIMQVCLALYTYTFISEASREATRYAVVRGSSSCTVAPTFPNCNLNPTSAGNPLQAYVTGFGYPGLNASNLTVTASWWSPSGPPGNTWTTACTVSTCNAVGNAVSVQVTYAFPLSIPFWKNATVNLSSTSQMMISE
jgi:Flp pilus assembly protein TadG